MNNSLKGLLLILFVLAFFTQCNNNSTASLQFSLGKVSPKDPFKKEMVESDFFEIDANEDQVVEGRNGTKIVCPKGCFVNAKGEIVSGTIKVELAEALAIEDILLSNLTSTSNGQLLETDGMIYLNATANGEPLAINKNIPVHIEIPTEKRRPNMMANKGTRDENGNMNWVDPKPLDAFLTCVDINSLNFLPDGFRVEVQDGLPYKGYKTATNKLVDSLYYSLTPLTNIPSTPAPEMPSPPMNEAYYNKHAKVKKGKYTDESFQIKKPEKQAEIVSDSTPTNCGIDPIYIKVIRSEKYHNTLIATREFEARLRVIFKTCNTKVLDLYIKNLDKNLYEIDAMAAALLKGTEFENTFNEFAAQKLTKVKDADKYAKLLKKHFDKQFNKVKAELEQTKEKYAKALKEKSEKVKALTKDYQNLLFKRESFRMESYGCDWTDVGWVNIDNGTIPKQNGWRELQVKVDNGNYFDRVYTYVIYTTIKSLYRLNAKSKIEHYVGNEEDKMMIMPINAGAVIIAIGYKNDQPSIATQEFTTGDPSMTVHLNPSTKAEVKASIKKYGDLKKENDIATDLVYMDKFYQEEQRIKQLEEEAIFMQNLRKRAFPCCNNNIDGEILFKMNCSPCHAIHGILVAPALFGITKRRSYEWLYQFTKNNEQLRASGDALAIQVHNENKGAMFSFENLSREEINAIYKYIESQKLMEQ